MQQHRRRRKQRSGGKRLIDVCRSINGFGFTISGQKPCIFSCIVPNSPAAIAGLRTGDFLILLNGQNVSKLPHEAVVQLISNAVGTIQLVIAENYFSDSSGDEYIEAWQCGKSKGTQDNHERRRPKYPHSKVKFIKTPPQNQKVSGNEQLSRNSIWRHSNYTMLSNSFDESERMEKQNQAHPLIQPHQMDVFNGNEKTAHINKNVQDDCGNPFNLEYRIVIGYCGTISTVEIPQKIVANYKLQTVQSCIRKMRQEKRQPSIVLMQLLPTCLKLFDSDNTILAKYSSDRISFVSNNNLGCNTGNERYFGLVTSTACSSTNERGHDVTTLTNSNSTDMNVSNSCHIFVIDTQLIDHSAHFQQAEIFSIVCTKDPITNHCLEFPSSAEHVVNLINSMYALNSFSLKESSRSVFDSKRENFLHSSSDNQNCGRNSPQPSNHSEVTTTSSNSDSGIGFYNDFNNIADRIIVVDFPKTVRQTTVKKSGVLSGRPTPLSTNFVENVRSFIPSGLENTEECLDKKKQCTSVPTSPLKLRSVNIEQNSRELSSKLNFGAKSYDNITTNNFQCGEVIEGDEKVSMGSNTRQNFDFDFLAPFPLSTNTNKMYNKSEKFSDRSQTHKLRASVYDVVATKLDGNEIRDDKNKKRSTKIPEKNEFMTNNINLSEWRSLQELNLLNQGSFEMFPRTNVINSIELAQSEPDLLVCFNCY